MHGAHGTKCYFLLRGLARVLMPENDPTNPGGVRYRYGADIGPGEVRQDKEEEVSLRGSVVREFIL